MPVAAPVGISDIEVRDAIGIHGEARHPGISRAQHNSNAPEGKSQPLVTAAIAWPTGFAFMRNLCQF